LKPWLDAHPHTLDDRFKDKVLMPGLIDPHLHLMLGAIQFGTTWIAPESWKLHDAEAPATRSQDEYRTRLRQAIQDAKGDGKPIFITWGWSEPEHDHMTRQLLDEIEPIRPVMIWQRSVHEAIFNTAALDYMNLKKENGPKHSETEFNWEEGHFVEEGLFEVVIPRLAPYLINPKFVDSGFARNLDYFTYNGVTTAGDLSTGQVDWDLEVGALTRNFADKNAPLRTVLIPAARALSLVKGGLDKSFDFVDGKMSTTDAPRQFVYGKRIKLFADGAMFSQLMQVFPPCYIDGHEGEWITPQDAFEAETRKYWNEGY